MIVFIALVNRSVIRHTRTTKSHEIIMESQFNPPLLKITYIGSSSESQTKKEL